MGNTPRRADSVGRSGGRYEGRPSERECPSLDSRPTAVVRTGRVAPHMSTISCHARILAQLAASYNHPPSWQVTGRRRFALLNRLPLGGSGGTPSAKMKTLWRPVPQAAILCRQSEEGPVAQWESVRFASGRSAVRIRPGPPEILAPSGFGAILFVPVSANGSCHWGTASKGFSLPRPALRAALRYSSGPPVVGS